MKICVYAIAKNEEQFVRRFCESVREADSIAVLDTGSSDRTAEALKEKGCIVQTLRLDPFRFDEARNRSMELIPEDTDICVNLDLDEVLLPGWRETLEKAWKPETESGRYTCICSRNGDGSLGTTLLREKLHRPGLFRWRYPVHEVLERADGKETWPRVTVTDMIAEHLPDPNKSRAQYLPLLELAVDEDPQDARCAHYLGREYMYAGRWNDAIRELTNYLGLHAAIWPEERAASKRYIARCYRAKGQPKEAMRWALRAICEQPELRENWYAAEQAAYELSDWEGVRYYGERAQKINRRSTCAINEAEAWGAGVYDLLGIAYWHLGEKTKALAAGATAAMLAPDNKRMQENLTLYRREVGHETQ